MTGNTILILIVICGYLTLLLTLSHFVAKGADNATFFTGNRKMPWPLVAIAMICAPISGVTFISVPGMVVTKGYSYLQMCLGFIVGYFIISWVLIPLFYKKRIISIYSYLEDRFGGSANKTGAWLFLVSKILGTAVKFFVICNVLQLLVFQSIGIPFPVTVVFTMLLIWLYTVKAGVKTVIWADLLKCLCLILSVTLCLYFIISSMGLSVHELYNVVSTHSSSRIFYFDNPDEDFYFWKQFIGGIFLVIAMTGLDQDMMQHPLSCKDAKSSKKNMIISSFLQVFVISLFLILGTLLIIYAEKNTIELPFKSDDIFATVTFHKDLPIIVGILFIIGLISATYSSIGSALTSLTTSYSIDISGIHNKYEGEALSKKRKGIHTFLALIIAVVIIMFYYMNRQDAISAVFTLASYTYGPILGLFIVGLFTKWQPDTKFLPVICILSPAFAWFVKWFAINYFDYSVGYELLLVNAAFTVSGLYLLYIFSRVGENINKISE